MKRHRTDLLALLFGLAFVLTGSIFIVYEVTDDTVDPAWVTAAGLILLGVVALIVTLVRAAQPPRNLDEQ